MGDDPSTERSFNSKETRDSLRRSNSADALDRCTTKTPHTPHTPRKKKSDEDANVQVILRARPANAQEIENGGKDCVEFGEDGKSVTLNVELFFSLC